MRSSESTWASACGWNICRTPYSSQQDASELGVAVAQRRPLLGGELRGLEQLTGVQVGVHRGQGDQVRGVHRGEQGGDLAALGQGLGEGVAAAVQVGAGGGAGQHQAAAAELVAQLFGLRRQVAEGPELDGGVPGGRGLVEEPVPGHLLRVVGEPDAPGVRRGPELQVGQGTRRRLGHRARAVGGHVDPSHRRTGTGGAVGRGAGGPARAGPLGVVERPRPPAQRVLFSAKVAIASMLDSSTNDGPVSTGWPPPRSLPLLSCSHSDSTAM